MIHLAGKTDSKNAFLEMLIGGQGGGRRAVRPRIAIVMNIGGGQGETEAQSVSGANALSGVRVNPCVTAVESST